jgi:hypothetical protein
VAIGTHTEATGKNSIAIGGGNNVSGKNCIGIGRQVWATGENVIAIGNDIFCEMDAILIGGAVHRRIELGFLIIELVGNKLTFSVRGNDPETGTGNGYVFEITKK